MYDASTLESAIAALALNAHAHAGHVPPELSRRDHVPGGPPRRSGHLPIPSIAEVGGLISYGNDGIDNYRRAAIYADRILNGAKPSELPVQAPVKFELVVNLKSAKALGLGRSAPAAAGRRGDRMSNCVGSSGYGLPAATGRCREPTPVIPCSFPDIQGGEPSLRPRLS